MAEAPELTQAQKFVNKLELAANQKRMAFDKETALDVYDKLPEDSRNVLMKIALCESGFKADAHNSMNKNGTSDGGLFQINSIHGLSNRSDIDKNIDKALELYEDSGTQPWNSSKHCWSSFQIENPA